MKLIVPAYYGKFKCIADRCRHSCCRGWEIDIDRESYDRYLHLPGTLGEKLRENMDQNAPGEEAPAHFRLDTQEKCPFFNEQGLCDLILEKGEAALCQICRDHPRFRNYWTDRVEIGLGMACEEAARVILSFPDRVRLVELEEESTHGQSGDGFGSKEDTEKALKKVPEEERELLKLREQLTEILQDRTLKTDDRVLKMLEVCRLKHIGKKLSFSPGSLNEIACEQLAVYLMFRHLADALYDGKLTERIRFVAESYCRVRNSWAEAGETEAESLIEAARAFSEDIEYDTDTWGL